MSKLTLHPLNSDARLVEPEDFSHLSVASPATAILTDFRDHKPMVVETDETALSAEHQMRAAHVRLKLVVDGKHRLVGTISDEELRGECLVRQVANGMPRDEVSVGELMRPRSELKAVDYQQLKHATIGDLIAALQDEGVRHCLVVEPAEGHVRGMISVGDIARRLHVPVDICERLSFADLARAMSGRGA